LLKDEGNEAYWYAFRQTPKILVTLAAGQAMWGNRFGDLMTVRFPEGTTADDVRAILRREVAPAEAGLLFAPVRQQALDAVAQAIDLGGLFLGMSFFLIASTLILTALFFVFGVQHRAAEMGVLLALGFSPARVRVLFLAEAAAIALAGACIGAAAGAAYTRLLVFALGRYWQGAVAQTAILYHAAPGTLLTGAAASAACAMAAMALAVWRQTSRYPARELLAMDFSQDVRGSGRPPALWPPLCGLAAAIALIVYALATGTESVVGVFFGAGALLLVAGMGLCRYALGRIESARPTGPPTLTALSMQNAARRPGRSLSVAALLATGCFLVLAVSSMQEDLSAHAGERSSGTGGFDLFAETTIPLPADALDSFADAGLDAVALRVYDGDDASCLNLNRAQTPRLYGVDPAALSSRKAFLRPGSDDVWALLDLDLPGGLVPGLAGDSDTAMWGLKKRTGVTDGDVLDYRDEAGNAFGVKLVGRLPMRLSVFQGSVIVSHTAFARRFPSAEGFRTFLIDVPAGHQGDAAAELNAEFERSGMDAAPAIERLRRFYTVESTYLGMFLVLGALGMALGSAALGIVVLRNLLERRREIAILRAVGFPRPALFRLFAAEHGLLLLMGLVVGGLAAAVAMAPTIASAASNVSLALQAAILAFIALTGFACVAIALAAGLRGDSVEALRTE
ncbi:MAG: ABC transporter permease, partial [Candidatus Hydrogenedentes bacterium]|nr:ABC transporter permease [Candidatus Hydrogenedentota bacterium]